jgi:hypothetical protein
MLSQLGEDRGSATIEFVMVYPIAIAAVTLGFVDIQTTQMRQLGITAIAREVSRSIDLGAAPLEVSGLIALLADDAGLAQTPVCALDKLSENNWRLTVSYRSESFSTGLLGSKMHPLWAQFKSESGSGMPLFLGLVGLLIALTMLTTNITAASIADYRANDLASTLALAAAGEPQLMRQKALDYSALWGSKTLSRVGYEVSSPDGKTASVTLCYAFDLIWGWLSPSQPVACAQKQTRILTE